METSPTTSTATRPFGTSRKPSLGRVRDPQIQAASAAAVARITGEDDEPVLTVAAFQSSI